ncbi:MAG: glycosyltransferase family 2 protein [Chlamydiae bacterium]|nr:glycosyltransferase family 2 protein [Chlamydiota bacterium]MBI3266719.1 glycosyltransferase family 2 protein [Chlamydiota bacterium]
MKKVCIIIPAYQEEGRIGKVVEAALDYGNVVVIDDGSRDETAREAREKGAQVIRHSQNLGKGAAVMTGLDYFLKGEGEGVILMDGDGQHDAREIPKFLEVAFTDSILMVVGNRMEEVSQMPMIRKWTNRFMSGLLSLCVGMRVPDTQCGFRYLKRDLVKKINLTAQRFDIESELLMEAASLTHGICSVPIASIYRNEKSKIKPFRDTLRFLKLILRSFWKRVYHARSSRG